MVLPPVGAALAANGVSATINLIVVIHPGKRICYFPSTQLPVPRTCKLLRNLHRYLVRRSFNAVFCVKINQRRLEVGYLVLRQLGVGADNDPVTRFRFVCSRAIDGYDSAPRLGTNGIGGEAFAVVQVVYMYLFILVYAGFIEQVGINRTGTLVLKFSMSNPRLVQFCFK